MMEDMYKTYLTGLRLESPSERLTGVRWPALITVFAAGEYLGFRLACLVESVFH
jgi:hypothetical protein